eukprot:272289-Pleurochrysis_carterae.AAC.3
MTASATASAKLSSEQSSAPRTKSASSSDFASEASVFINSTPGAEGAAAIQAPELSAASGSGSSVEKPVPNREFSSVRPAHFDRTHAMSDNGAFDGNAPARSATTLGSSSPAEVISCCGAEAARIPPAVAATRTSVVPSLPTIAAPTRRSKWIWHGSLLTNFDIFNCIPEIQIFSHAATRARSRGDAHSNDDVMIALLIILRSFPTYLLQRCSDHGRHTSLL